MLQTKVYNQRFEAHDYSKMEKYPDRYRAIPFDSSWLTALGFYIEHERNGMCRAFLSVDNKIEFIVAEGRVTGVWYFSWDLSYPHIGSKTTIINYVHELQNLIFALTKIEIKHATL